MYDIIIIGGGPAGLSSAIYGLRAMKKVFVIEKENFGGQIVQSSKVENYPGCPDISGMELGEKMYDQAKSLGMESTYGEVTKIEKKEDNFVVNVGIQEYTSKVVIYAGGASPRKLGVPNEQAFVGLGLSYCATCDGAFFKGKTVAVVGGGNTAIDDAIYLSNICEKVYLVHRREEFRAEPVKVATLKERANVEFILNATVQQINGDKKIENMTLNENGIVKTIPINGIFAAIGHVPNTSLLEDFIPLNASNYITTNYQLETQISGFYAAGDVREKKVRQLTTATSDGTIAAITACEYLDTL